MNAVEGGTCSLSLEVAFMIARTFVDEDVAGAVDGRGALEPVALAGDRIDHVDLDSDQELVLDYIDELLAP